MPYRIFYLLTKLYITIAKTGTKRAFIQAFRGF